MRLDISTRHSVDSRTIVSVAGELDFCTAGQLRHLVADLVQDGHHDLVVDLGQVSFMDSTGLGVLVGALTAVRGEGGTLVLVVTASWMRHLLAMTGLDKVFVIVGQAPPVPDAPRGPVAAARS